LSPDKCRFRLSFSSIPIPIHFKSYFDQAWFVFWWGGVIFLDGFFEALPSFLIKKMPFCFEFLEKTILFKLLKNKYLFLKY
jgi:hypothetical protein